jgi:hypothetical protein
MSFFADIIADSRRKIMPIHRPDPISGPMPVQVNSSQPVVSEAMQDRAIGHDEGYDPATKIAKPDTTLPTASSLSQTSTTHISTPSTRHSAKTDGHVLQDPVTSHMNASVVPTVQLKAEHKTQSSSALPKEAGSVSGDVGVGHNEMSTETPMPDARLVTKQINRQPEQLVEKSVTSPEISMPQQHALKQGDKLQSSSIKAKLPPDQMIDRSGMMPEVTDSGVVTSAQSRQEDDQQGAAEVSAASAVIAAVQIESPAAHVRQVNAPVASMGHMKDASSQQPRVQIGQVNVVIEQPAAPRRSAGAVAGNDDYASRNFLKSL